MPDARAIVVCPLPMEGRRLRRELPRDAFDVTCCGPGPDCVRRWADGLPDPTGAVILAGLAGALCDGLAAGSARAVTEVRAGATIFRPPLAGEGAAACSITSSVAPVATACAKRALAETSGADLVDLESVAFTEIAAARGWRWGIVRGVSDDARTDLPRGIERWLDERGNTRGLRVLAALAARPALLRDLRRLGRDSRLALDDAARVIREMVIPPPAAPPAIR